MNRWRRWLLILTVLPTFACQAAMRLVSAQPAATSATAAPLRVGTPAATKPVSCSQEARSVLLAANLEGLPPSRFPSVDTGGQIDIPLVTYKVHGDELSTPMLASAPDNLMPYQREFQAQRATWQLFTSMIPEEEREMVRQFVVMTDGPGGVLSAVEQTADDPRSWMLEADIADMRDTKNLAFTLLHEYGHLLTLGPAQVPPDIQVFNSPAGSPARQRAASACSSYFPGEGCSREDSYLNQFFNRFWRDIYDQWSDINDVQDADRRDAQLHAFYHRHQDEFVDSYAVTSPAEDIAESWAFFLLSPRPSGTKPVDQKLSFFYSYPELVALRERILEGLCAANP